MKLTKYQHACLVIEKDGTVIVVDPGKFSHDFIQPHHVDAIVITHEHPDHLDDTLVNQILAANPKATIVAHESISGRFTNHSTLAPKVGEVYPIGTVSLQFFGGDHAAIDPSMPVPPNLGVLIDGRLYYPGDSFVVPTGIPVHELALPVAAPWLKISETTSFLSQVHPSFAFPTHDAILTTDGKTVVDGVIGAVAAKLGTNYKRLDESSINLS